MKTTPGSGRKAQAGSSGVMDRHIIARIENYALNNDYTDVDEVVEHLRRTHKEYQRKQLGPFRQMVIKAIGIIQRKGGVSKPELKLQTLEDKHLASRSKQDGSSSDDDGDSQSDSGGDASSDAELAEDQAANVVSGLNNSLLNMYTKTNTDAQSKPSDAQPQPSPAPGKPSNSKEGPAFAPPHIIAAMAAKAAAEAKATKSAGKTASQQGKTTPAPSEAAAAAAEANEAMSLDSQFAQAQTPHDRSAPPGETSGKDKRSRDEAGLRKDRSTVKKSRKAPAAAAAAKASKQGQSSAPRAVTYADLGGIEEVLADIRELIEYPLKHPEVYAWLGVEPPRGVLLHGPPGCGKTALASAIANECGCAFLRVSAPEVVSGMSGESEAKLRQLFADALSQAPCIVFIDEIDAIAPKRETAQREMERRIVAQMLTCMDDLGAGEGGAPPPAQEGEQQQQQQQQQQEEGQPLAKPRAHVIVIGATNRPDALDPALRRAGRFDREISLGIPTEAARKKILQVITRRLRLEGNFDFAAVAKRTPGFVGADLQALTKEAAAVAVTRIFAHLELARQQQQQQQQQEEEPAEPAPEPFAGFGNAALSPSQLQGLAITMADFESALPKVQPSVRREGFTTKPDVTWDDVGSLTEIREELSFSISQPIAHPERFEAMGLRAATGVLLYGPPGCGKTLVAKAVANESGANFISIKGPELLNKYVGESERAVRQLFARARAAHPCVLFFDELDALAPRRGTDSNQAAERVVNQLLTEMDGIDGRQGVFLIAATNRPDMIDPALLRPGRLDKVLYVPLPPPDGRVSILRALTRKTPLADGVDLQTVGMSQQCNGFSGADMAALVREACVMALKESLQQAAAGGSSGSGGGPQVHMRHFEAALRVVVPSVSKKDQKVYDALRTKLRSRSRLTAVEGPAAEGGAAAAGGGAAAAAAGGGGSDGAAAGDGDEPKPMLVE